MITKKLLWIAIAFLIGTSFVFAEEQDTPDWFKRIEFSGQWETDKKPIFYFQTVQPLYQDESKVDTVFIQPRISQSENDLTYNLGIGYRRLVSEDLLLGINTFGDYEDENAHGRLGLGLEAFGQVLESRFNAYWGITPKRIVKETSLATTYERVASGYDFEIGVPVPYLPWLKVYQSGFFYDFKNFDDKAGWKGRVEARLNDAIRMEFFAWDDNKGKTEYGGQLRFNLAFNNVFDFKDVFQFSDEPFPKKDLKGQTLIPVERRYDIVVEKWDEGPTTSIEIYRGN